MDGNNNGVNLSKPGRHRAPQRVAEGLLRATEQCSCCQEVSYVWVTIGLTPIPAEIGGDGWTPFVWRELTEIEVAKMGLPFFPGDIRDERQR